MNLIIQDVTPCLLHGKDGLCQINSNDDNTQILMTFPSRGVDEIQKFHHGTFDADCDNFAAASGRGSPFHSLGVQMKRYLLFSVAFLLSACAHSEPKIPSELVGIWANDGAILRDGKWLMSGQALYLGADGSGAVLGGPPPIGVKITATFDATKNALSIDLIERDKVVKSVSATYDPNEKTINMGSSKPVFLTRRSEIFDSNIKKGLGL